MTRIIRISGVPFIPFDARNRRCRHIVQFDTACAVSTSAAGVEKLSDVDVPDGGGRITLRLNQIEMMLTAATNASAEKLPVKDHCDFHNSVRRWCREHCKCAVQVFTSDVWVFPSYACFEGAAYAMSFAAAYHGRIGHRPSAAERHEQGNDA